MVSVHEGLPKKPLKVMCNINCKEDPLSKDYYIKHLYCLQHLSNVQFLAYLYPFSYHAKVAKYLLLSRNGI